MSDLAAAVSLLTRVRVGPHAAPGRGASGWLAAVGLALGATAAVPAWLLVRYGWDGRGSLALGLVAVAWWAWATRMLHWDGLADTFDGLWGAAEPARRIEIMADSRIGSFGATAIAFVALAQAAGAGASLAQGRVWPLVLAPVLGRTAATLLVWGSRPLRRGGLGAALDGTPPATAVLATVAAVVVAVAFVLFEAPELVATASFVSLAVAIAVPFALSRPFGGYTGDILGATILLVEAAVLVLGGVL